MIAWLLAILSLIGPASAVKPAERLYPPFNWQAVDAWSAGCTYTRVGGAVVTAAHCVSDGWSLDGDIATRGSVDWATPGDVVYAVGFPVVAGGRPIYFTLTVLSTRMVDTFDEPSLVLMTRGSGVPCSGGASGMIAWTRDGRPVGPMSVYSTDPAVTGLPAGEFVCGFAVAPPQQMT